LTTEAKKENYGLAAMRSYRFKLVRHSEKTRDRVPEKGKLLGARSDEKDGPGVMHFAFTENTSARPQTPFQVYFLSGKTERAERQEKAGSGLRGKRQSSLYRGSQGSGKEESKGEKGATASNLS